MWMSRVRFTVGRVMTALVIVIAGSLVVGSMSPLPGEFAEVDALIFGVSYATELGLGVVLAVRYFRETPHHFPRPNLAALAVLVIVSWATIEWPVVRGGHIMLDAKTCIVTTL